MDPGCRCPGCVLGTHTQNRVRQPDDGFTFKVPGRD
jgi:hypothetical protein